MSKTIRRVITRRSASGDTLEVKDNLPDNAINPMPNSLVCDVWRSDSFPQHLDDGSEPTTHSLEPTKGGILFRYCEIPPEQEFLNAIRSNTIGIDIAIPEDASDFGMHQTETIDLVTVVSGEVYLRVNGEETLLRPGNQVVQRGANHAWKNKSSEGCVLSVVMIGIQN